MLETQPKWYKPAWEVLGWHIGLWNVCILFSELSYSIIKRVAGQVLEAESSINPPPPPLGTCLATQGSLRTGNTDILQLIGALGFTLCGALGPAYGNSGAQYEASLATFWGSWAFLIGSLIQWYESLDKHPVIERSSYLS